jgi:succinate dehydrogenase / fumarate reductase membrane anchor subunit
MSGHRPTIRTPLSRVRGLGSAHSGSRSWWLERMTSLALVPLTIWFLAALISHLGESREIIAAWLGQPLISMLLAVFLFVMFWHSKLGLQVIIEDYVHAEAAKIVLLLVKDMAIYALGIASLFAIVKLHFIGIA